MSQVESNHAIYMERLRRAAERDHYGETALMVDGEIIEYFADASDAYVAGCEQFGSDNFSLQEVGAISLGLLGLLV